MVKNLLLLFWMFAGVVAPLSAENNIDKKDTQKSNTQWLTEWTTTLKGIKPSDRGFALISRCAVVIKKDNSFKFIAVDPLKATRQSVMETPDKTTVELSLEINHQINNAKDDDEIENPCEKSLSSAAKCYNADAVLDVTGPKWRLYRYVPKFKKMKMIFERPAGESTDYFKWMQEHLNFDGVILENKDDLVVALIPTGKIEKGAQALTINNSARLFGLNSTSRKGSGLLSIIEKRGRLALFKLVVTSAKEKDSLTPGTKIILEKSKTLKAPPPAINDGGKYPETDEIQE